jgi:hypothetical protein
MGNKRDKPAIKSTNKDKSINKKNLEQIDYPVFCFKYLQDDSIKGCKDSSFFIEFLLRMKKLSELGWKEIKTSGRHSFGIEKLPIEQIKPQKPQIITPDVNFLSAFRATGSNHAFLGIIKETLFHVIYIETNFGDIYGHD